MGPKYEFTHETIHYEGHLLHRIKRLSDGKYGGWIEKEENLSQEGDCWVYDNAKVYDNAYISDSARVYNNAKVYEDSKIYGHVIVSGNVRVYGKAQVYDDSRVYDNAQIYGEAEVYDEAEISGNAKIYSNACIYSQAEVYGNAQVYDDAEVQGEAKVYGDAKVYGHSIVYGDEAKVYGHAEVYGDVLIYGDAQVYDNARVYGNIIINSGKYTSEYYCDEDSLNENVSKDVIQDFIYKVDDSNKITTQTEYDSVDDFFNAPIENDMKLDTLVICTVDTKEPLIKLQKVHNECDKAFKYIVEITSEKGDDFIVRSTIKTREQLTELIQQTIDALKHFTQFSKYVDDLEECL